MKPVKLHIRGVGLNSREIGGFISDNGDHRLYYRHWPDLIVSAHGEPTFIERALRRHLSVFESNIPIMMRDLYNPDVIWVRY